jgi:hypothetical protein
MKKRGDMDKAKNILVVSILLVLIMIVAVFIVVVLKSDKKNKSEITKAIEAAKDGNFGSCEKLGKSRDIDTCKILAIIKSGNATLCERSFDSSLSFDMTTVSAGKNSTLTMSANDYCYFRISQIYKKDYCIKITDSNTRIRCQNLAGGMI